MTAAVHPFDFTPDEYQRRLALTRQEMARRGAELLLIDQLDHIAYFFGYLPTAARYQAALLPLEGEPHMIVRELDFGTFKAQSWLTSYETCTDEEDSVLRVAQAIAKRGVKSLAVEKDSNILTIKRFAQLSNALPNTRMVDFSGVIWELRLIKSAEEVAYLEQAAAIASSAVLYGASHVIPGKRDTDAATATYQACIDLGADNTRMAVFGHGCREDSLLGGPNGRTLEEGEIYFIETIPQYRGYSARLLRPVAVGTPSIKDQELARALVDIQDEQIAAMQVGAVAGDVHELSRKRVLYAGIKDDFPQLTGYTLGYHAVPRTSDHTRIIAPNQQWRFEPGMVFHVVLFAQGIPFSETVLIEETGPRILTQAPRSLLGPFV